MNKILLNNRALVRIYKANCHIKAQKREKALIKMRETVDRMEAGAAFITTLIK
jgi:hypothetical protein